MLDERSNEQQEYDINRALILKCANDIFENKNATGLYQNLPYSKEAWEMTKELNEICQKNDLVIDVDCDSEFELGYSTCVYVLLDYPVDNNEKLVYAIELSYLAKLGRTHWLKRKYVEGFTEDGTLIPMNVKYSGVISKEVHAIEKVVSNAAMNYRGYNLFSYEIFDFVLPFKINKSYQKLYNITTDTISANMFFFGI